MSKPAASGSTRGRFVLVSLTATALIAAGCGGDDEDNEAEQTGTTAETPTRTVTVPARRAPQKEGTETTSPPKEEPGKGRRASPEESAGGAGDEEAARSEVVLTGRGGKIGPVVVKVPPFIAIRVVLRSGDGKPYVLRVGNKVIRAGFKGARPTATFDGLRPGKRLLGSAVSGKVVIEASAEPGP